ncbi:amino acid adenylation enzyme/thioester reductase family protein [Leptolyngbyaceae cyanobacterium JSC-12]|nr:amino acid adenylation enzyme/thioester reductase family protein [Leptolyngbyaceae cyanobacterium JSC-12]
MGLELTSERVESSLTSSVQPRIDHVQRLPQKMAYSLTTDAELAALQLPGDFLNAFSDDCEPEHYAFSLPGDLSDLSQRSLLFAAFSVLLYRYTQQTAIDLELTLADAKLGSGYTLPLQTVANENLTSQAFIREITDSLISVQKNLSDLQASLTTSLSRHEPKSAIALSFIDNISYLESEKPWLTTLWQVLFGQFNRFNLHLIILPQKQATQGVLRYNANLFKPGIIQRLVEHLQILMEGMLRNPDCQIARLPLLTQAEERQLLVEWSSGSTDYPQIPVHQYIEAHALRQPDAIALKFNGQQLTYAELNQRANQLAHYLMQMGIGANDRVAVCVEPSLDISIALLAVFKAGGTYVPLDPTHPTERLTAILEDTQPKILLTQSHLLSTLPAISAYQFCFEQDWQYIQYLPTYNPHTAICLDQTAYVVYTSGTTGKPKGVMATYGNLVNYILVARDQFSFDHHDVMPAIARFTFSITMFELLSPLVAGGTLVILEREHVLDFKRMVQTLQQVTVAHLSPSLLRKLIAYIKDTGVDIQTFRGLKHISSGGDMVSADLLESMKQVFPSAEIYVIYGCSEISCMGCFYPVPPDCTVTRSRVGKPFKNVSVRLYDPQQNLVPVGVVGEIYFGGAGVTQGYLNRAELTQEKFVVINGQRFYRTGDLGRFDTDGNLEILGRSDFQIKLRGIRIEPGEIEVALRQAPGVRDGVVMARELGTSEKSLVAYVVLDPAQKPAIEEIRRFLQTKLPDYMVPVGFVVLEAMPVNMNQKIDRRALPLPTPENLAGFKPFVAPRDEYEQRLAEIWEFVLGIRPIGVQDNFFDIGGDSLQAVILMDRIEKVFGKALPLSTLLTESTIEQLAAVLKQAKESDIHKSVVLLRKGGSKPPIFFIHDGEGETLLYRNLAFCLKADHPVYGLQPYSRDSFPILHTRIGEMASYYTDQIRQVQPEGPYFLGGLCIGGFLAFEIARRLQNLGHTVAMVALIDTADVQATVRTGLVTSQRFNSFSKSLSQSQQLSHHQRIFHLLKTVGKKARNLIAYEVQSRAAKSQAQIKMQLLRYYLDRGLPLPSFLQNISVRVALKFAEKEYVPEAPFQGEVLLFRATQKSSVFDGTEIDDTPYTEIYSDPLLGWEKRVTDGVRVYDVPGGHSSMLQDPNVQVMAEEMQLYIDTAIATYEHKYPLH